MFFDFAVLLVNFFSILSIFNILFFYAFKSTVFFVALSTYICTGKNGKETNQKSIGICLS